jgi:ribosomal protein S18 acetylase RimI-like enzyme
MSSDKIHKSQKVDFSYYDSVNSPTTLEENELVDFLFESLDEFGDPKHHIRAAIEYSCSSHKGKGGFVVLGRIDNKLVGAVVINQTGMSGYIPENILVYIAVDSKTRGMGVGKQLMTKAMEMAKGSIALHVEPNNPAKFLYEKLGFTNKYLEMRYQKK